jgi:hypothetical protein
MATTKGSSGQSALSNFDQKMYSDFSGGYNDTSAAINIEDNQLSMSENADYSAELKALQTRKGCVKVNETSFGTEVTDGYAWLIGSVHKKCIVKNGKVFDFNTETGVANEKITLTPGAKHIYPYIMYNVLYFGDGTELYTWGQFDYSSELGKKIVNKDIVVKCNDSELGSKGHFYRYKQNISSYVDNVPDTLEITEDNLPSQVTVYVDNVPSSYQRPLIMVQDMASENILTWKKNRVYVNVGPTDGRFTQNHWFYYDSDEEDWADGGSYVKSQTTRPVVRSVLSPYFTNDISKIDFTTFNKETIIVNKGNTDGRFLQNHWFYHDGEDWVDGGSYNIVKVTRSVQRPLIFVAGQSFDVVGANKNKVYVFTSTDGRFIKDHWFYYSDYDWQDGGVYRSEQGTYINLDEENYYNSTYWADVTDVPNYSSSVVRKMKPFDPSQEEKVKITVYSSSVNAGPIVLCLNDVSKQIYVTAGTSVSDIITKLRDLNFTEWTSTISSENTITFTCNEKKVCNAGYIDTSTTGVQCTYNTIQEGKSSNCDISDVKKCTVFCVHQGSNRVFAAGNPEDNAVYYSEIGHGDYFQSKVNKLYPAVNGYGRVTGMCNLSSSLIISYENGWYTWRGITPLQDAYWEPLNIPYGCVAPRTLCLTPQGFTFLAKDGIYSVSVAILSEQYVLLQTKQVIKKISEDAVENTIDSFINKSLCTAVFYDNMYMISYSTNGDYCNKVLKYEWDTGAFTLLTGWKVNNWINDHENLFFASSNYVLKAFEGYSDINTETGEKKPIELHVKTKDYYLDTPQANKVLQMIAFIFQQHENVTSPIHIIIHAGYKKYELISVDLAESLYYGRMWGTVWGYRHAIIKVAELVMVSNTFQIEILANNLDDPMTLLGIGFSYADTDLVLPTILKDEELLV